MSNRTLSKFQDTSEGVTGDHTGVDHTKVVIVGGHDERTLAQSESANRPFTSNFCVRGNAGTKPFPGRTNFKISRISLLEPASWPPN